MIDTTTEVVKSCIKKLCGGVFLFWEQMLHAVEPNQYMKGNFKMMFFHLSHDNESSIPKKGFIESHFMYILDHRRGWGNRENMG